MHQSRLYFAISFTCTLFAILSFGCRPSEPSQSEEDMTEESFFVFGGSVDERMRPDYSYPDAGILYDPEAAATIARAYLTLGFGKDWVASQLPLHVCIKDDVWIVKGDEGRLVREERVGGVMYIELDRKTGKLLSVGHEL